MSNSEENKQIETTEKTEKSEDKEKKPKDHVTFANVTVDWITQILLIVLMIAAIFFVFFFSGLEGWIVWTIFAVLVALIVFFTGRFIYKLHNGQLSIIRVELKGVSYTKNFKRVFVPAENLVTGLVDYGKVESGKFYIGVADKNDEVKDDKEKVVFLLNPKRMEQLTDTRISPPQMISFLIGLCDDAQLKESLDTANPELKVYVRAELDKRANEAAEVKRRAADKQRAEEAERNRRKNKKKKKHK